MNILNLTQHQGSVEQLSQGLVEPSADNKVYIKELLTLNNVPNPETLESMCEARAELLLELMEKAHENGIQNFLIGGHPLLIQTLIRLNRGKFYLLGAQSNRVTVEDNKGNKISKFKHMYFYTLADGSDDIDYMELPTVIL